MIPSMLPGINPKKEVHWPKDRLSNFTDSVFAFAITLLVLNIMETALPSGDKSLFEYMVKHSSMFVTYILTFLIVSRFWISHTRLFALIREYDRTVVDLNMLLLFFISLFPFVAVTFGNHIGNRDASMMYAGFFAAIGLIEYLIGKHVYTHDLLIKDESSGPHSLKVFSQYSLTAPTLFIASILVAFISPVVAECMWLLLFAIRLAFRFYFRNNKNAEAEFEQL